VNALTTLLPPNSTALELAGERAAAARYPLPAHLVSDVWSPDACPEHLLGFLAWGLSIDLWDETWPETKKRQVCRKAFELHRLKCTVAGIRAHVELTGAKLLKVDRPPAIAHLQRSMTDEQRRAWLDSLPQVRIYPYFSRALRRPYHGFFSAPGRSQYLGVAAPPAALEVTDAGGLPLGGISGALASPDGKIFLLRSRGFNLYHRRATYYDNGVEVDATLSMAPDGIAEQIAIRRSQGRRQFLGSSCYLAGYLLKSAADFSLLTVRISDSEALKPVVTGAEPVDVRPQRIAQRRIAPAPLSFFGRHKRHLSRSYGPLLIYDRLALAAPGRFGERLKVTAFHGHGRFGIPPFTAELKIKVPMRRPGRAACKFHGQGFRRSADMTPLVRALEAVRVSKALRDTALVDTTTVRRVTFDSSLRFGEFNFGEMRKAA
jgi:phage tail P2-like protein